MIMHHLLRLMCALAVLSVAAWSAELDAQRVAADAQYLAQIPDRGQGRSGAATAAQFIEERLRSFNLQVLRTTHAVTISEDRGSTVELADGQRFTMTPLAPNLAATPGTLGEDVRGPLFRGGNGTWPELAGCPPGAVVVLSADSRSGWSNAAQVGARAVLIENPERLDASRLSTLSVAASIEFPRFAITLPATASGMVTLRSTVAWRRTTADSVIAVIPGRERADQAIILAAGYEANGPLANEGALRAWNAALLLETVRHFSSAPPRRTVIAVFHGARGEALRGLREVCAALMADRDTSDRLVSADKDQLLHLLNHARNQAECSAMAAQVLNGDVSGFGEPLRERWRSAMATAAAACSARSDSLVTKLLTVDRAEAQTLPTRTLSLAVGDFADRDLADLDALRERLIPAEQRGTVSAEIRQRLSERQQTQREWRSLQLLLESNKALSASEAAMASTIAASAAILANRQAEHHRQRIATYASLYALRSALSATVPVQLLAYEFSDGHDRWGAIATGYHQGGDRDIREFHNVIGEAIRAVRRTQPDAGCDAVAYERSDDVLTWWPSEWMHDAGMAGQYLWSLSLATHSDLRQRQGTPCDRFAALDQRALRAQIPGLERVVRLWSDAPDWDKRNKWRARTTNTDFKPISITIQQISVGTRSGMRGAGFVSTFLIHGTQAGWNGDVSNVEMRYCDLNGGEVVPFLPGMRKSAGKGLLVRGYRFAEHGGITGTLESTDKQHPNKEITLDFVSGLKNVAAKVFDAVPSRVHGLFDPRLLAGLPVVRPLSARREGAPTYARSEIAGTDAAIFTEGRQQRLRLLAGADKIGNRLVLTGATASGRAGGIEPGALAGITALESAMSMTAIDEARMNEYRRHGIESDALVSLHASAQQHLRTASAARASGAFAQAQAAGQSAWSLSTRVYPKVLSTANDVVLGLVVLLLFTLPFAMIVERLLLAGATIGRKVAGFSGCFAITFVFFYFFHPGFALATTPMVIFLAFLLMLSSGWVIAVIYQRFELEMSLLRRHGSGVHNADVSRLGTLVATVGLGVSNMRRRPLRTVLTWMTVCLMTFILLTFASFNAASGFQRLSQDAAPPWNGVLLRANGWGPLHESTLDRVALRWGAQAELSPLRWLQPTDVVRGFALTASAGRVALANGVIGVSPREPSAIAAACRRMPDDAVGMGSDAGWIFVPPLLQKKLGVAVGETVSLRGVRLRLGTLDPALLGRALTIGAEPLTPLAPDLLDSNQQNETKRLETLDPLAPPAAENTSPIHIDADTCVVVDERVLRDQGAPLRALSLVPHSGGLTPEALGSEMAHEMAMTMRVGSAGETELVTAVDRLSVAGLGAVLVPLILGGLIIFSTMLNSVAERGREIFTYAALGLAPIHVGALFMVEAGIYAVIGGLGGYMVAQLVVSLLGVAASLGLSAQPDLNYSSFTAVATILLVMATVLTSALYPAWLASRAATPGGGREFSLPKPDGDVIDCPFPFTVPTPDAAGVAAFLHDHLAAHSESSAGAFTAADAELHGGEFPAVSARVWLPPFDLGLSQRVRLSLHATDMRGIMGVRLRLELLSGQRGDWLRANSGFMRDLRLQFLVWRTLPSEVQQRYRDLGAGEPVAVIASEVNA